MIMSRYDSTPTYDHRFDQTRFTCSWKTGQLWIWEGQIIQGGGAVAPQIFSFNGYFIFN